MLNRTPMEEPDLSLDLERRRDGQQWILDWMVKTTGREQNFEYDDRLVPPEAKSYAMIPAVMYRRGAHVERIARSADDAGDHATAVELYVRAAEYYKQCQHAIFEDDNPEKIFFHQRLDECFDRVIALNDYPMERVEIEWEGRQYSGILHLLRDRRRAPTILYCPGMDNTKEGFPDPTHNYYGKRGMNTLAIDGPGQGVSNIRKNRVTENNYEQVASAFIDWLVQRPEVDEDRIGVSGTSQGSYWGSRIAATDRRVKAVATTAANYGTKRSIFEVASPRFKQIYMYMAGIHDEAEFDRFAERLHLYDLAEDITCAALMAVGEYDPLCPLREAREVFERLGGPKEFWLVEDEFHSLGRRSIRNFGGFSGHPYLADWLWKALNGAFPPGYRRETIVGHASGVGPYGPDSSAFLYPERAGSSHLP